MGTDPISGILRECRLLLMTNLLEKLFAEAAKLSNEEQDAFAQFVLAELESEERWSRLFATSQNELATLAQEALADYRAGRTRSF